MRSSVALHLRDPGAGELAAMFAALADPTRVEMLRLLMAADEVACTTFDAIFPISKSTISYHVKALRQAGLIRVRKEAKYYHYSLLREDIEQRMPGLLDLLASIAPRPAGDAAPSSAGGGPEIPHRARHAVSA